MPATASAVEREIRIDATPDTVFDFLVDADKVPIWMGRRAELDPRAGGVCRFEINDQATASGEFVEVDRPNRVVFTFGWERGAYEPPPGTSTVEITLTADGDGTIVRLVHSDLPEPAREPHAHGWEQYLNRLSAAAQGQDPGPDPNAG
jgi:uncharacterized protein YndB with AHSA1/START domain